MKQYLQDQVEEQRFRCSQLPLAIYREIAAHLRQVPSIEVGLLPQTSKTFDYTQGQAGGLWIRYAKQPTQIDLQQIEAILEYYEDRYGVWQRMPE